MIKLDTIYTYKRERAVIGMIDLYPKAYNICGGHVILTSNSIIYGKVYGTGNIYYCTR